MLGFRFAIMLDDCLVNEGSSDAAEGLNSRHVGDSGQKMHTKMMGIGQTYQISGAIVGDERHTH
jgi:hypothetical protein